MGQLVARSIIVMDEEVHPAIGRDQKLGRVPIGIGGFLKVAGRIAQQDLLFPDHAVGIVVAVMGSGLRRLDAGDAAGRIVAGGSDRRHVLVPPGVPEPVASIVAYVFDLAGGVPVLDEVASRIVPEMLVRTGVAEGWWIGLADLAMEGVELKCVNSALGVGGRLRDARYVATGRRGDRRLRRIHPPVDGVGNAVWNV